jgi:hypothetical protein
LDALESQGIACIIAARLNPARRGMICQVDGGWALEPGLESTEWRYRAASGKQARRLIVVRQSVKRKSALGRALLLFTDDPDIQD